jgi:tRNA1(Val) A37 N6-methylase TrmN6
MTAEAARGETVDGFLGNRVRLIQPESGHRAGLDAALLQALVPDDAHGRLIDLGTGTGAVAMAAAARAPALTATGVDIDAVLIDMAGRALAFSENEAIRERVEFIIARIGGPRPEREAAGLADASADWVTMNPPFDVASQVRASPDEARRRAHVGDETTLADWIRTASGLLKPKGRLAVIHRADALDNLLAELRGRFGAIAVRPVHPREDEPANRILVTAIRGSSAPLKLLPALIVHGQDGGWGDEALAVLNDAKGLAKRHG